MTITRAAGAYARPERVRRFATTPGPEDLGSDEKTSLQEGAMGHYHDVANELREPARALRAMIPETMTAFAGLHAATMQEGAIPARLKEVIALTIAVVKRCDGCIVSHARGAARAGASAEEVAEAIAVAVLLDGGSATVWGPRAYAAYQEYRGE
jgi:AhpD family alkylhydroperoxidase